MWTRECVDELVGICRGEPLGVAAHHIGQNLGSEHRWRAAEKSRGKKFFDCEYHELTLSHTSHVTLQQVSNKNTQYLFSPNLMVLSSNITTFMTRRTWSPS